MTLYFSYGSNMSRAAMRERRPGARAVGTAVLEGHCFYIGLEGWGSVRPSRGGNVFGVLWRLTPRDIAALHAYELLHTGLYDVRWLPVRHGAHRGPAMLYRLQRRIVGSPRPGYIALCAAAAREWALPDRYVRSLERWSLSRSGGAQAIDVGR